MFEVWKSACLLCSTSILVVLMHNVVYSKCSQSTDFHTPWGQCFQADPFLISGTLPGSPTLSDLVIPDYFLWGSVTNKVHKTDSTNTNVWKLNLGVYWNALQGNATMCGDILYIATAGVYWKTWWSPTKCCIKRVKINMTSHGHGMFPSLLIICSHFSLKCYFISKVLGISGSACVSPLMLQLH